MKGKCYCCGKEVECKLVSANTDDTSAINLVDSEKRLICNDCNHLGGQDDNKI